MQLSDFEQMELTKISPLNIQSRIYIENLRVPSINIHKMEPVRSQLSSIVNMDRYSSALHDILPYKAKTHFHIFRYWNLLQAGPVQGNRSSLLQSCKGTKRQDWKAGMSVPLYLHPVPGGQTTAKLLNLPKKRKLSFIWY